MLLGTEDHGKINTASASHRPLTHQLPSLSSCPVPSMALLPSPSIFQDHQLAIKSTSAHSDSLTTTLLVGAGGQNDDTNHSPRPSQHKSVMQHSVERISTRRIKGDSPDRSQIVQMADKKAQAEKHRNSEQRRRKGTSYEIHILESHIPAKFLDGIKSRSTKLRHTKDVPVSVSRPSKNGVLGVCNIYMEAMEDGLTAAYEHQEELRQANATKDKLIQELRQTISALAGNIGPSVAPYPTPPDSPKLNKCFKSANTHDTDDGVDVSSPPSKRSKHEPDNAYAEWTDWEDQWQNGCPKPHEGKAWESDIIGRMDSIQCRQLARKR